MLESLATPSPLPPTTRRPRLAFAGLGWIGRHRLDALARSGAAEVTAVFDPRREAVEHVQAEHRAVEVLRDERDILACDADGVVIATPNAQHAALAVDALRRGKAVFCQKPLGRNRAETEAVIATAAATDRLLQVDLSYRWTRGMQRIRELTQQGALGRIYAVEAVFHNAYGPDKPWFYDAALSGGGCLLDLGIHLIDLALWSLGFPVVGSVSGQLLHHADPRPGGVEDYAAAQLLLANGVSVQLACSWRVPAGADARIGLTFFGTEGGACFHNLGGSFYDFEALQFLPDRTSRTLAAPPEDWGGRAAIAWAQRLAETPAFDPAVKQLVSVADVIDRLYGRLP